MTSAEILELVRMEIVDVLDGQRSSPEISPDSTLVEDLGLGSLEAVSLIMSLEDKLEVELSDDEVAGLHTVGDIVNAIESKLGEATSPGGATGPE